MKQNLNFLNYEAVALELSKGLQPLSSEVVIRCNLTRAQAMAEYRTIGFTGVRQTGKTRFIASKAEQDVETTLIVFPNRASARQFTADWAVLMGNTPMPTLWAGPLYPSDDRRGMSPVLEDKRQFKRVFIDDAQAYFSRYRHGKFYRAMAELCDDDVIITHVG